jgi:hypothetical protein
MNANLLNQMGGGFAPDALAATPAPARPQPGAAPAPAQPSPDDATASAQPPAADPLAAAMALFTRPTKAPVFGSAYKQ